MKQLVFIWPDLRKRQLMKDVFLVPYYIGKIYNCETTILYLHTEANKNIDKVYKGVKFVPVKCFKPFFNLYCFFYLLLYSKKIDCLMRFHLTFMSAFLITIYKTLNNKGKAYLKMDSDNHWVKHSNKIYQKDNKLYKILKISFFSYFSKVIDVISIETKAGYDELVLNGYYGIKYEQKLKLMANGFNEEELKQYKDFKLLTWKEKDNIMISVGRHGTYQKNTEFLLSALAKIDLKNWKVYIIGPIESDDFTPINVKFMNFLEGYFNLYPQLKEKIIFTGAIYNKKELWTYFNQAKALLMSSRNEGSPIVLTEARRFGLYLISTVFDAAVEYAGNGNSGLIVPQGDMIGYQNAISSFITKSEMFSSKKSPHINTWYEQVKKLQLFSI